MENRGEYRIKVTNETGSVEFGFNRFADAVSFFGTCADTVDDLVDGKTTIAMYFKKED